MTIDSIVQGIRRYGSFWVCLALLALVWTIGPYLRIGETSPFESPVSRWLASLIILLSLAVYLLARDFIQKRNEKRMTSALLEAGGASTPEEVRRKFRAVLEGAGRVKVDSKPLRLQALPWYLVIGPPGSGKTSAIRASGMRFPARDLVGAEAVRGVGGTRNCSWWISTEAVMVDTAGRYTTQTSNDGSDRLEWEAFLAALKDNNPKQPINGLMVFIGADTLCNSSDREFESQASSIAERIREAITAFGVRMPVYVMVAKMDQLPGFLEAFEDVGEAERRQALGIGLGSSAFESDPAGLVQNRLHEWLRQIEQRIEDRLARERNRGRVDALLGLSGSVNSVSSRLARLAERIVNSNDGHRLVDLRGVYFCSALQTGEFIDRIASALGASFAKGSGSEDFSSPVGRPYFLEGVFRKIAFPERTLAGTNSAALRRSNMWVISGTVGIALILVSFLTLMGLSYFNNRGLISSVRDVLGDASSAEEGRLDGAIDAMRRIGAVRAITSPLDGDRPIAYGAGLAQAPSLEGTATDALRAVSRQSIGPLVVRLTEQSLVDPSMPAAVRFELLKTYLMLGGKSPAPVDPELVGATTTLLLGRMPDVGPVDAKDAGDQLAAAVALGMEPLAIVDLVVERARSDLGRDEVRLAGELVADRVLAKMVRAGAIPSFSLSEALGPNASAVFEFDRSLEVPGIFTADGARFFDLNVEAAAREFESEVWVLGPTEQAIPYSAIQNAAVQTYVARYTESWDRLLGNPRVTATGGAGLGSFAKSISGSGSPIVRLLKAAVPHMSIEAVALAEQSGSPEDAAAAEGVQSAAAERLMQMGAGPVAPSVVPAAKETAIKGIREHYRDLIGMMDGTFQPSLSTLLGTLGQIASEIEGSEDAELLIALTGDPSAHTIGALQSIREMQRLVGQFPEPIQSWLAVAVRGARSSVGADAVAAGATAARRLAGACPLETLQRYPISPAAGSEASPGEMAAAIGSSGFFRTFFDEHLAPVVDRSSRPWRFSNGRSFFKGVRASDLEYFRNANDAASRLSLDSGGVRFRFPVNVVEVVGAGDVAFRLGGKSISWSDGSSDESFEWSPEDEAAMEVVFSSENGAQYSVVVDGMWSLFRAIDQYGRVVGGDRIDLLIPNADSSARIQITSSRLARLFSDQSWRNIRCPEQ